MTKKGVELPGEEGTWVAVEYDVTECEPNSHARITVALKEWPGAQNLRVFVREKEFDFGSLEPGDVIEWRKGGYPSVIVQPITSPPSGIELYEVVGMVGYTKGRLLARSLHHSRSLLTIFRDGEQIYPPPSAT